MKLILLFAVSFLAATIFPAQSEALLVGLYQSGYSSFFVLFLVASFGNILGACVNWYLGRFMERYKQSKWFPVKEAQLARAKRTYQKFGVWTLLLAWVPFIGDPLTVIAGFFRTKFPTFLILVSIGKVGRYTALLYGSELVVESVRAVL